MAAVEAGMVGADGDPPLLGTGRMPGLIPILPALQGLSEASEGSSAHWGLRKNNSVHFLPPLQGQEGTGHILPGEALRTLCGPEHDSIFQEVLQAST